MKVRALVTFAGQEAMYQGEVKEITDKGIIKDLLGAGYIEAVITKKGVVNDEAK